MTDQRDRKAWSKRNPDIGRWHVIDDYSGFVEYADNTSFNHRGYCGLPKNQDHIHSIEMNLNLTHTPRELPYMRPEVDGNDISPPAFFPWEQRNRSTWDTWDLGWDTKASESKVIFDEVAYLLNLELKGGNS